MSKSKLIINSLTGTSLYVINIIVAFIMSPIMINALGNAEYGLWEMVMGVIGYMGLLDLGVGPALLRYVAVAHSKDNQQDLQNTVSTAMVFFLSIGAIAMLIFLGLSVYPQFLTGDVSEEKNKLSLVLLLFAVNSALTFPLAVYLGILLGLQKHHLINTTRSIITIARASAAYYLLLHMPGKGLLVLVCLEISCNALQFIIYASALKNNKTVPGFSLSTCSIDKMRELFGYGAKSAVLMAASRLQFASMPFIIGKVLGLGFIVYFVLPNRLVDYVKGFALTIGFPLTPYFASMIGSEESDALKSGWLTTSFILQIITVAMPIYLFFCGTKFLELWIGPEYAIAGQWVMYALLLGLAAEALSPNARQILLAKAEHGRVAIVSLVMSICSIPLAFFGAKSFGVAGAALGSSVTTGVISLITLVITCRVMKIPLFEYFRVTLLPIVIPLLLLGFTLWGSGQFIRPNSYYDLLLQVCTGTIVYLTACWKLSLSVDARTDLYEKLLMLRQKKLFGGA